MNTKPKLLALPYLATRSRDSGSECAPACQRDGYSILWCVRSTYDLNADLQPLMNPAVAMSVPPPASRLLALPGPAAMDLGLGLRLSSRM